MSSIYREIVAPIEHLGGNDHVTATQLRNCMGIIAAFASGERQPEESPVRRGSVDSSDPPESEPEPESQPEQQPEEKTEGSPVVDPPNDENPKAE